MRHSIGSRLPVTKGKILSPPRGKSIPGIGKPSPSTMKKTTIPPTEIHILTGDDQEQSSTDIPVVPVL